MINIDEMLDNECVLWFKGQETMITARIIGIDRDAIGRPTHLIREDGFRYRWDQLLGWMLVYQSN